MAGRTIRVLWAPASETKPHRAPGGAGGPFRFWIRLGSETVDAEANGMLMPLLDQTARVPWDDRRAFDARIDDLREAGVREYLRDVRSGLQDEPAAAELYRRLRLTARADGHELPRNVALLFFADDHQLPGPGAGHRARHLTPEAAVPAVPARNRRIGEFLKELDLAEGRLTGLAKIFRAMEQNGSPPPRFDFDVPRTWFRAVLPIHPGRPAPGAGV